MTGLAGAKARRPEELPLLRGEARFIADSGADVRAFGVRIAEITAHPLTGPYRVPAFGYEGRTVVTNKPPIGGVPGGETVRGQLRPRAPDRPGRAQARARSRGDPAARPPSPS